MVMMHYSTEPPPSLRVISRFLKTAQMIEKHEPLIAFCCTPTTDYKNIQGRTYAVQIGIELRSESQDSEALKFLTALMDLLERDKDVMKSLDNYQEYVKNFALQVFRNADEEDRAGRSSKITASQFLQASIFIESLKQFDEMMNEELANLVTYAKSKATDIMSALKEGRKPTPGPPPALQMSCQRESSPHQTEHEDDHKALTKLRWEDKSSSFHCAPNSGDDHHANSEQRPLRGKTGGGQYPSHSILPVVSLSPSSSSQIHSFSRPMATSIPQKQVNIICDAAKHTKSALSALEFDDIDTAINSLQKALDMLTSFKTSSNAAHHD